MQYKITTVNCFNDCVIDSTELLVVDAYFWCGQMYHLLELSSFSIKGINI